MMLDGATVPIQAVATDLNMRPLKGKVEGKNTGKNVLVTSLSGIGEAGALLLGRGSLNQPLSESDLIRERVSASTFFGVPVHFISLDDLRTNKKALGRSSDLKDLKNDPKSPNS